MNAKRIIILYVTLFVSIITLAIAWQLNSYVAGLPPEPKIANYQVNKVTLTDQTEGALIKPENLVPSCAGPDCIVALNLPRFEPVSTTNTWLSDEERVIGLVFEGVAKAYPEKIISRHIIINDLIHQQPLIITFSPLTSSANVYQPVVNKMNTQFGVSGLTYQSDIIMYDRLQGNLWQQLTGRAIVGPAAQAQEVLTRLPLSLTTWSIWKQAHPDTQVLSKKTGFVYDYNQLIYQDYQKNDELRFKATSTNKILSAKSLVYGLQIGSVTKAYPETIITAKPLTDRLDTNTITIERQTDGTVIATDIKTKEIYQLLPSYWFAWSAFYPQTLLYQPR